MKTALVAGLAVAICSALSGDVEAASRCLSPSERATIDRALTNLQEARELKAMEDLERRIRDRERIPPRRRTLPRNAPRH